MTGLLWALIVLPGGSGLVLLAAGRRVERAAGWCAITVAAITAVLAITAAVWARGTTRLDYLALAPVSLRADALSVSVAVVVSVVALLVLLVALPEIDAGRWRFYALMLVFVVAVLLTVFAASLLALLAGWEVMGATSYALIAHDRQQPAAVRAGGVAFVTTRAADVGLYLAAGAAIAGTVGTVGSHGPGTDRLALSELAHLPSPWLHLAAAGVLVAALGKAAQLPFSFWLSGAMRGPSPVSALLHSAAMVAMGGYLLLRLHPLLAAAGWAATAAAWVGAVTAVVLGAVALLQTDLKQLLAASTSAQLGFVVLAAGITAHGGAVPAGWTQLAAHAATKALLFLVAGVWLHALGTRDLARLRGAARAWPVVGAAFTLGALSLAGVPPLSLWAAKDSVLAAARAQSLPLYLVGLAGAALGAAYAARALGIVLRHREQPTPEPVPRVSRLEQAPLVVLAAAATVLGVLELPPLAGRIAAALGERNPQPTGWGMLVSSGLLALVVVAIVARYAERLGQPRWAATWLGSTAIPSLVTRPVLGLGLTLARVDDHGLDRAVVAAARRTVQLAALSARLDDHGVDATVTAFTRGARRLGSWARRPQTGLVHQYYAQAAVLLAAAVVLLALVG